MGICEHIVDAPTPHAVDELVPQLQGGTLEVIQSISTERISERIVEKSVAVPGPQIQEETVEVIQLSPLELLLMKPELQVCTTWIMQTGVPENSCGAPRKAQGCAET